MFNIDLWYDDKLEAVKSATYTFYPNDGEYRGNVYNAAGKTIGDYTTDDLSQAEKTFNIKFD